MKLRKFKAILVAAILAFAVAMPMAVVADDYIEIVPIENVLPQPFGGIDPGDPVKI